MNINPVQTVIVTNEERNRLNIPNSAIRSAGILIIDSASLRPGAQVQVPPPSSSLTQYATAPAPNVSSQIKDALVEDKQNCCRLTV